MVVSKGDIAWDEDNVSWASQEMRNQLDHLGCKDPDCHNHKCVFVVAEAGMIVQRVQQRSIVEQCEVEERGDVDRIDAPRLAVPN